MVRAGVVAGKAVVAMGLPFGFALLVGNDIVRRAHRRAMLAAHAMLCLETPVARQEAVEERAQHVTLYPRHRTAHHLRQAAMPCLNFLGNVFQFHFRRRRLLPLRFRTVHIEAGQADIRVAHLHREHRVCAAAIRFQEIIYKNIGHADVVAAGAYNIYICILYPSDAADDLLSVDIGGSLLFKKNKNLLRY